VERLLLNLSLASDIQSLPGHSDWKSRALPDSIARLAENAVVMSLVAGNNIWSLVGPCAARSDECRASLQECGHCPEEASNRSFLKIAGICRAMVALFCPEASSVQIFRRFIRLGYAFAQMPPLETKRTRGYLILS
jgi:hypothetical protein